MATAERENIKAEKLVCRGRVFLTQFEAMNHLRTETAVESDALLPATLDKSFQERIVVHELAPDE